MINLVQKQSIIIKHREGVSNRQIAIDLGIDKNTVNSYVNEYEEELRKLLESNPDMDSETLHPSIMEEPKYNTDRRDISEASKKALPIIERCLAENAKKRETGRSKQQMRKVDIHHYLNKRGIRISYSTVKRLIKDIDKRTHEAYIRQEHMPGIDTEFDWGEVKLNIGSTGYETYQMAVFATAYGNHRFARLYRTQDGLLQLLQGRVQKCHLRQHEGCRGRVCGTNGEGADEGASGTFLLLWFYLPFLQCQAGQ